MIDLSVLADNLLSPTVLCFGLGVLARLVRSDLRFPEALTAGLSIYLLLAIGLKGGVSLRDGGAGLLGAAALTLAVGAAIPVVVYNLARRIAAWPAGEAASLAAHYGSTSAVTFLATMAFLERNGQSVEGFMPALLAIMEVPAIVVGLALARRSGSCGSETSGSLGGVLAHVVTGKTVLLLLGGMLIGWGSAPHGLEAVMPFFTEPFAGILALFLLELGLIAGASLNELRRRALFLVPFGIVAPLVFGGLSVMAGCAIGLSPGGATAFGILAGSASYIAAPAAMRMACPDVNHGLALSASLGVTFPFNLAFGIPILASVANWCAG
ncbi:MAG: sodium-dependent bicarbonate transport family permease [Planctomycetota bacterium]|jgi:hypothetical protein|nr:sodium-dependent bicarbonate transport family permease [Planctomycetota bacterium]